jgi:hypothetical protein
MAISAIFLFFRGIADSSAKVMTRHFVPMRDSSKIIHITQTYPFARFTKRKSYETSGIDPYNIFASRIVWFRYIRCFRSDGLRDGFFR